MFPTEAGRIELLLGAMYTSKTETMLSRVKHERLAQRPCVVVKSRLDTRYTAEDMVITHSNVCQASCPASEDLAPLRVVTADRLAEVALADSERVVGVDEGQFYPDLDEVCDRWANEGRRVIVAALDGNYRRGPFGRVPFLIPLCESVEKLKGVCMDCRRAETAFTRRLGSSTEEIDPGTMKSYRSVCRRCYIAANPALTPSAPL